MRGRKSKEEQPKADAPEEFGIEKPHEGTEIKIKTYFNTSHVNLELRNPMRGRKSSPPLFKLISFMIWN